MLDLENKKVRGTKKVTKFGINFKSTSEAKHYELLVQAGLNPEYEPEKFILFEGFKPQILFITQYKLKLKPKVFDIYPYKIRDITYTPDFKIVTKSKDITYIIYIDSKGFANDTYPLKKKMFLKLLENKVKDNIKYIFVELHNIKEVKETIELIKKL